MTAPTTDEQATVATPPAESTAKPSLEDSLASLDEDTRKYVLGEVTTARGEAKKLRERVRAAEVKANAYDTLEAATKTDAERAQEAVRAAEDKATAAYQKAARAEVKAALAGVVDNPDTIVDDLNLARFVDDDGEVDADAVKALRDKYAALGGRRAPAPDRSQASGANGRTTTSPAQEFASLMQGLTRSQ